MTAGERINGAEKELRGEHREQVQEVAQGARARGKIRERELKEE